MKKDKIFSIEDFQIEDGGLRYDNKRWKNSTLFRASEGLETYDLQIAALDFDVEVWSVRSFGSFLYHSKRIEDADMSFPVIQMPSGFIADGWHRIAKAILRGDETIKCVRLKTMPEPDSIDDGSKG